jgi:hypothetical protein
MLNIKTQISQSEKNELLCSDNPNAHPAFLRSDLEYSILGVDCEGDEPFEKSVGLVDEKPGRSLASSCTNGPHDHPVGMRVDYGYQLTGKDCFGDSPNEAFNF